MVNESENAIEVTGLYNRFGMHSVHENLNLTVKKGEILGVVGGSGTGKSVLLRSIVGLIKPQAGIVKFSGKDQANLDPEEARIERSRWGVLFQDGALFSSLTVAQNIQVPLREYHNLSEQLLNDIAAMKVNMVGLPPLACDKLPSELSGGMRKRAGIARALALDPKIVFLDTDSILRVKMISESLK
jgi:phospholipid/cholesterol/gamma-HCH transport system ATP-binding protein